jgi:uncharacterized protein
MFDMRNAIALVVGLAFGLGLCLSGMNEPSKILAFLDLAGVWDPSLAFVMGGAIAVALPIFAFARRRRIDWIGDRIDWPDNRQIDAPLAFGAVIFGVGWGLAGLCPGPAIVDVGFLSYGALIFVASMAAGVFAFRVLDLRSRTPRARVQDA